MCIRLQKGAPLCVSYCFWPVYSFSNCARSPFYLFVLVFGRFIRFRIAEDFPFIGLLSVSPFIYLHLRNAPLLFCLLSFCFFIRLQFRKVPLVFFVISCLFSPSFFVSSFSKFPMFRFLLFSPSLFVSGFSRFPMFLFSNVFAVFVSFQFVAVFHLPVFLLILLLYSLRVSEGFPSICFFRFLRLR